MFTWLLFCFQVDTNWIRAKIPIDRMEVLVPPTGYPNDIRCWWEMELIGQVKRRMMSYTVTRLLESLSVSVLQCFLWLLLHDLRVLSAHLLFLGSNPSFWPPFFVLRVVNSLSTTFWNRTGSKLSNKRLKIHFQTNIFCRGTSSTALLINVGLAVIRFTVKRRSTPKCNVISGLK